ncbi:MAG: tetratricopeptide repeat protein [Bacteroidetes bacterium]|nr:tetratricopeptide repeat protein [Bacteroidota bacterium]
MELFLRCMNYVSFRFRPALVLLVLMAGSAVLTLPGCGSSRQVQVSELLPEGEELAGGEKSDKQSKEALLRAQLELDYIEGVRARQLGDLGLAEARFQDVLRADPVNAAAYFELARLRFEAGDIARAIPMAQRATLLENDNPYYTELYADMLTLTNQYDKAAAAFQELVKLRPDNPEPYFQLAYTLQQSGQLNDALKAYDEVQSRFGAESSLFLEKHRIYVQQGKLDKAAIELEQVVRLNPDDPQYYEMLARIYESDNKPDKAAEVFEKLLVLESSNPGLLLQAARIYRSKKDYVRYKERSQEAFDQEAISIDAKVGFLLPWIDSLGTEFATRDFVFDLNQRLIKAHPRDPKSHALNGDFLFHDKRLEEARASYMNSLALEPSIFDVWRQVFAIDLELRQNDSLAAVTSRAADIFPNQPAPFYFSGYANIQLDRPEEAVKSLKRALPMSLSNPPLRSDVYSLLGDAYHSLNDHANSDESYEKSLEIRPDNAFVLNNYAYYLSLRKENLERAAQMAAQANELSPGNASFEDTYAWVLFQLGRYPEAKLWQEKALANGGEKSAVQNEHYGDILFRLGQEERAVEAWKKARELGGASEVLDRKISERRFYE